MQRVRATVHHRGSRAVGPAHRATAIDRRGLNCGGALSGAGSGLPAAFEREFGAYVDADYCLAVDNGSTVLASAYYADGVGPADEFIRPSAGYDGGLHMGARPGFAETIPDTLPIDVDNVEDRITERTATINVIHKHGRVCDIDTLRSVREQYDVPIVHDAVHAHGATWDGTAVGALPDVACFSLQGVPPDGIPVAAGEGARQHHRLGVLRASVELLSPPS